MRIAFDPNKNTANKAKHGVSLAFARHVLADPKRIDILDIRFAYDEERIVSYCRHQGRIWVCVFTMRGETHRIISLRKANARETKRYFETHR